MVWKGLIFLQRLVCQDVPRLGIILQLPLIEEVWVKLQLLMKASFSFLFFGRSVKLTVTSSIHKISNSSRQQAFVK